MDTLWPKQPLPRVPVMKAALLAVAGAAKQSSAKTLAAAAAATATEAAKLTQWRQDIDAGMLAEAATPATLPRWTRPTRWPLAGAATLAPKLAAAAAIAGAATPAAQMTLGIAFTTWADETLAPGPGGDPPRMI